MAKTIDRLRSAAEDLLLEKGQAATTLRDITDRAGVNVASVNYHFGTKDALLEQVFRAALGEVTEVQRRRLAALPVDAPLEDVVRVWLSPALAVGGSDPREGRLWALVTRGLAERAPGMLEAMASVRQVVDTHLVDRLAAALPHLGRPELALRHAAVLGALASLRNGEVELLGNGAPPERTADMLVAWIVGGLRAPSGLATGGA